MKAPRTQPATSRKRPRDLEGAEQAALFSWLRFALPELYEVAFHVPNGGNRDAITGARLKREGVKAGVPDIFIDLPAGGYHGLRIEFKATPPNDAVVTESQRAWVQRLKEAGYLATVCRGQAAAKELITDYAELAGIRSRERR